MCHKRKPCISSRKLFYSITSSARARRVGDNWIPSAFATLRLINAAMCHEQTCSASLPSGAAQGLGDEFAIIGISIRKPRGKFLRGQVRDNRA